MNNEVDNLQALAHQRHSFSIPDQVSYLNCAYMSPLSNSVLEAGQRGLLAKAHPYKITAPDFFDPVNEVKKGFADLIEVENPERIVIIPSVSYGLATVAKNLNASAGQNIVLVDEQFPSNAYCWHRLGKEKSLEVRTISPPEQNREEQWNQKILDAIDENTLAVSIGIIHWADGTVFDLLRIRNKTKQVGAKLILDGTQAIGAMPFSIKLIEADALICAAYKWLMGPYSIGLAYFGPEFDLGKPLEENWINRIYSDDFQGQVGYQDEYRPYAVRFDMGEKSNFILLPMLTASIGQVTTWRTHRIQQYCRSICQEHLIELQSLGFRLADEKYRMAHLFGIRPPKNFYIEPVKDAMQKQGVFVSFRGNAIRVSPHVYNSEEDMAKLVDCLSKGL